MSKTENGVALLDHLKTLEKKYGIVPDELKQFYDTKCPPSLEGFYFCWLTLHERRTYGEYGPHPLTFPEIKAWKELMDEDISPYGIELICSIDRLYIKHQMERMKSSSTKK